MTEIWGRFIWFIKDVGSSLTNMLPEFFLRLVNLSIIAGWLVLVVLLLRMLVKKAPKWVHCALWGLVGIRLVLPFSLESAFSLVPSTQTFAPEMLYSRKFQVNTGIAVLDKPVNEYMGSRYYEGVTVPADFKWELTTVLAVIWLLGIVVMLGYALVSYLKLKKEMATSVLVDKKDSTDTYKNPGIKMRQSEKVSSPFVLGLFRPVIYLPYGLKGIDMSYVIAHEEAHIKRRDHWIKPMGFVLLSVYWFQPLLWVAYVMLCKDIELACDEKVIGNLDIEHRQAYSMALLNCSMKRYRIAACPLAFGEVSVKERVKSVMYYKKPGFWMVVSGLVVCGAVAVFFLTDPAKEMDSGQHLVNEQNIEDSSGQNSTESIGASRKEQEENIVTTEKEQDRNEIASKEEPVSDDKQEHNQRQEQEAESNESEDGNYVEQWISEVILEHNKQRYPEGEFACESHQYFATQQLTSFPGAGERQSTSEYTIYMLVYYQVYSTYGGELKEEGGSCMPVKLTYKVGVGKSNMELIEYWEPRSGGADYVKDIQENIPELLVERFLNAQDYVEVLRQRCQEKALAYLEEKGSIDEHIETLLKNITSVPLHASLPQKYAELMDEEYEQLAAYGEATLRYSFEEFLKGGQTDLRGHIMAELCQDIMVTLGEAFIVEYEPATGQEWFDAFLANAHVLEAQYDEDSLQKYYPASWLVLELQ